MHAHIETLVILWLGVLLQTSAASELPSDSPAERALQFFAALPMTTIEAVFQSLRPEPISAQHKERALRMLPLEGELVPTTDEATKLGTLQRVLIYHKREGVFEVKVVDVPEAAVVLYSRSIVLVSRPALRLLSALELQTVVAHEIGHEYFWDQQLHVRDGRPSNARRELELRCDAIAILTLLKLDLDPTLVVSSALKLTRFNERLGMRFDAELYPTVPEREQFTRAILNLVRSRTLAADAARNLAMLMVRR
jgi:hypothetical protein